jgi:ABC-type glycerol-3-phosphate transport system substrate-binding protein
MILRKTKKLKNTLLALSSALALTACGGGGGGGGAVGTVSNFVQEDLSTKASADAPPRSIRLMI